MHIHNHPNRGLYFLTLLFLLAFSFPLFAQINKISTYERRVTNLEGIKGSYTYYPEGTVLSGSLSASEWRTLPLDSPIAAYKKQFFLLDSTQQVGILEEGKRLQSQAALDQQKRTLALGATATIEAILTLQEEAGELALVKFYIHLPDSIEAAFGVQAFRKLNGKWLQAKPAGFKNTTVLLSYRSDYLGPILSGNVEGDPLLTKFRTDVQQSGQISLLKMYNRIADWEKKNEIYWQEKYLLSQDVGWRKSSKQDSINTAIAEWRKQNLEIYQGSQSSETVEFNTGITKGKLAPYEGLRFGQWGWTRWENTAPEDLRMFKIMGDAVTRHRTDQAVYPYVSSIEDIDPATFDEILLRGHTPRYGFRVPTEKGFDYYISFGSKTKFTLHIQDETDQVMISDESDDPLFRYVQYTNSKVRNKLAFGINGVQNTPMQVFADHCLSESTQKDYGPACIGAYLHQLPAAERETLLKEIEAYKYLQK